MPADEVMTVGDGAQPARVFLPGVSSVESALLEEQAFCDALGLRPTQLVDRLIAGSLFFIEYEGRRLYPEFLTDSALNPAAIKAVSRVLRTVSAGGRAASVLPESPWIAGRGFGARIAARGSSAAGPESGGRLC